jgi:hypothetical protein
MPTPAIAAISKPVADLLTAIASRSEVEEILVVKLAPLAIGVRRAGRMKFWEGDALLTIAQRALADLRREVCAP